MSELVPRMLSEYRNEAYAKGGLRVSTMPELFTPSYMKQLLNGCIISRNSLKEKVWREKNNQ